jgi:hypothetical protein
MSVLLCLNMQIIVITNPILQIKKTLEIKFQMSIEIHNRKCPLGGSINKDSRKDVKMRRLYL